MRPTLLLTLWLLSDLFLFVGSFVLAYFLRVGWIFSSDLPFNHYLTAVCLSAAPWLLVLATTRTFALTRSQADVRNALYILYAAVVGAALVTLAYFFLFQGFFSRGIITIAAALSTIAIWGWHIVYEQIRRSVLHRDPPSYPTLIVGVTRESRQLVELLKKRKSPLKPVAILDGTGVKDKEIAGVPVLGKLNRLGEVLTEKKITHLIQCADLEQSLNLLSACRTQGITYMLLPSVMGIIERDERIESLEGKAVTVVSPERGMMGWFFR